MKAHLCSFYQVRYPKNRQKVSTYDGRSKVQPYKVCAHLHTNPSPMINIFQTYVPFRKHGANLYAHVNRLITLFIINIFRTLCLINIKLSTMTSFKFIINSYLALRNGYDIGRYTSI